MGTGGTIAGIIFFFYRGRTAELTTELAAERLKVNALQAEVVGMLKSQIEGEPARRETMARLTRFMEDQNALLKGKIQ